MSTTIMVTNHWVWSDPFPTTHYIAMAVVVVVFTIAQVLAHYWGSALIRTLARHLVSSPRSAPAPATQTMRAPLPRPYREANHQW